MKQNEAARARLSAAAVAASIWCDGERNIIYICVIDGTECTITTYGSQLWSPLFTQVRQNSMRLVVAIIFSRARLLMVVSLLELYTVVPPFTFLRGLGRGLGKGFEPRHFEDGAVRLGVFSATATLRPPPMPRAAEFVWLASVAPWTSIQQV